MSHTPARTVQFPQGCNRFFDAMRPSLLACNNEASVATLDQVGDFRPDDRIP